MRKILYLATLTLALSCSKEKEINNLNVSDVVESGDLKKYIPVLQKLGYNTEYVEDFGNSIIIEGDIALTKRYLDSISRIPNFKQAMWSSAYLTGTAVSTITVYANSSVPSEWVVALQEAVNHWTNITGSVVTMTYSTSPGTITVKSDNGTLGNGTIAQAGPPPNSSTPYPEILLNLDAVNGLVLTHQQKVRNLVHELGHCIGFRHTNWASLADEMNDQAWEIHHGVPTSDPNSVMNGNTGSYAWAGFSTYDVLAAELVYPQWTNYTQIGGAVWPNTFLMTSLNGYAYVVQYSLLYRIDISNGTYTQIGPNVWSGAEGLTALNGYIYIVQNSRLYRVDPYYGSYVQLGGASWPSTQGMCTLNGYLYIVQNSRLYRVDSNNGTYIQLGGANWPGTVKICSLNGYLYIIQNSRLYRVDSSNGSYTQLGGIIWAGANGITGNTTNNMLYIVQNDLYYMVNPTTGIHTRLGGIAWPNANSMTSIANYNYIIQNSRFYRVGIN